MSHSCNLRHSWPTGHPLPPEDPDRLEGPEVGTFWLYTSPYREDEAVVRILARSYVWSPGECRQKGGYRHYDWSVVEEGPGGYRQVVVNDEHLSPLPEGSRVRTVYALKEV